MCEACDAQASQVQEDEKTANKVLDSFIEAARHAEGQADATPIAKFNAMRQVVGMAIPPFVLPDLVVVAIRRLIDAAPASSYVPGSVPVEVTTGGGEQESAVYGMYL